MRRIYLPQKLSTTGVVTLSASAFHYLVRVLRCRDGECLVVFNGDGMDYTAQLRHTDKKSADLHLQTACVNANESPLHTTLLQGLSKGERMDIAIQKAVELGVNVIYPVLTDYCSVKLSDARQQKKHRHWQGIISAACEQSERAKLPLLHPVKALADVFAELPPQYGWVLHAREQDQHSDQIPSPQPPEQLDRLTLLIGPEGGLSAAELALARQAGLQQLTLGKRILRTETATLTALSLAQSLWGDYHVKRR